jgi:hypothetical protein
MVLGWDAHKARVHAAVAANSTNTPHTACKADRARHTRAGGHRNASTNPSLECADIVEPSAVESGGTGGGEGERAEGRRGGGAVPIIRV